MKYPYSLKIFSEDETKKIADDFSKDLQNGDVIILNGELGSGKTFFVRQAAKNFGIKNVSSPTFAIVNEYCGGRKIYHFDFYRIEKSAELFDIGFNDYINDRESIIFIEWGNLFSEILPKERIEIKIIMNEDLSRDFKFEKYD